MCQVRQIKDLNRLRGLANMMQLRINMVVPKSHIKGKKSVIVSIQNFVTSKVVPSCMCVRNVSHSVMENLDEAQKSPIPAAPLPTTDGQKIKSKPSD